MRNEVLRLGVTEAVELGGGGRRRGVGETANSYGAAGGPWRIRCSSGEASHAEAEVSLAQPYPRCSYGRDG